MTYLHPVLPALLVLILLGVLRGSRRVALPSTIALFLWISPPVAWLTAGILEWRYPVRQFPTEDVDAFVVLSGSSFTPNPSQPEALPAWNTYARCRYAAWLYRTWRPRPIVVTGGPDPELTAVMREVLESEGIPAAMIRTESRSHSTYENAAFTAALLLPAGLRRIALVTEAYHMPRADACFRKQGFFVVAAPFCYRTLEFRHVRDWLVPSWRPLLFNDEALHEYVGLVWYRLAGRT